MIKHTTTALRLVLAGAALATAANAQAQATATKKDLVQHILQAQQLELEGAARSIVERPAALMVQSAAAALQQLPVDKREATGKQIEAEVRKYIDESYPLVRERALKDAPLTIGATLEEKMSEDELKQLAAWLDSPVNKKYQQLGPEMRNGFIQKVLADAGPVVDPKVRALDARIRVILGLPPAPAANAAGPAASAAPKAAASRAKATGK